MLYEVSNYVFNHKPTKWEVQRKHPFYSKVGKDAQRFYTIPDTPQVLFKAYSLGHSIKPRAFHLGESSTGKVAFVNTIVLDFDNLTKLQCEFVKGAVNGKYRFFNDICGDYSAGMKSKMKENAGIPDYEPERWKYKVFFPVQNCLCRREDIYRAFLEAVAFFNPIFPMDEVERVWGLWVKANNKKSGRLNIYDDAFKGWILPDVAMLNSYRTQVTYSCDPEQKEKMRIVDDFTISTTLPVGMDKYPVTRKDDYEGLDWDDSECAEKSTKQAHADKAVVAELSKYVESVMDDGHDFKNALPVSKCDFAKKLRRSRFDDLVLPEYVGIFSARRFSPANLSLELPEMKKDAARLARMFTYLAMECRRQGGDEPTKERVVESTMWGLAEVHGMMVFNETRQRNWNHAIAYEIAASIVRAGRTFGNWRARAKLNETTSSQPVLDALARWRETRDSTDFIAYLRLREKDIQSRTNQAASIQLPYTYGRRDAKNELLAKALNRQVKMDTAEKFVEWAKANLNGGDRFDGEFKETTMERWFEGYRSRWNATHPASNQIERKRHRRHRSKWSEVFNGKSRDEILATIDALDLSKQMKYKLRVQYAR